MLTMEAYLDNSATTRCSEAAKNKMVEALTVDFGNPSSMHMKGVEAGKNMSKRQPQLSQKPCVVRKRRLYSLPVEQSPITWQSSGQHWQTSVQANISLPPA